MSIRFKAECLAILDQVDEMKISVTATKHGRPIARVVPPSDSDTGRGTMGTVRLVAEDDEAARRRGSSVGPSASS